MSAGGDAGAGVGSLIGGGLVLAGAAGEGGKEWHKKAVDVLEKVRTPDFDYRDLSAPELQMLEQMVAQTYDVRPAQDLVQVQDSPEMRASQLAALKQMEAMASGGGATLEDRLAAEQAQRTVMSGVRGNQQALAREMRARGRAGGGSEMAMRAAANQQAANAARDMGGDLTRQILQRRLAAAEQAGSFAGAMRGQDIQASTGRANVANRYNEFLTGLRAQASRDAAMARERAQQYNVGTTQRIGDTNVLNRYGTQLENLNRRNELEGARFGADFDKARAQAQAYSGFGAYEDAERDRRAAAINQMSTGAGQAVGGAAGAYFGGF